MTSPRPAVRPTLGLVASQDDGLATELVRAGSDTLLPGLGILGGRLTKKLQAEWRRNTSRALKAAEQASGLSREDLEDLLSSHPETVPLLVQVLYAAGTNGHDATLRSMGAALGLAAQAVKARDSHTAAEIESALRSIRDFDDRHFAVLGYLMDLDLQNDEQGIPDYAPFSTEQAAIATGMRDYSAATCCLALAGAGLVRPAPRLTIRANDVGPVETFDHGDSTSYLVNPLGRALWEAARLRG